MAGSRRKSGREKRSANRRQHWLGRITGAADAEAQFDAAADYVRAVSARLADPGLLNCAARYITGLASERERRGRDAYTR
jgi:hypothetical protein